MFGRKRHKMHITFVPFVPLWFRPPYLKRGTTQNLVTRNRVAMFACRGYLRLSVLIDRALCNGSDTRSEIASISQRIQFDAEYGSGREAARRNALLRNCGGAGHLDAPGDGLTITAAHRPAIGAQRNEMEF